MVRIEKCIFTLKRYFKENLYVNEIFAPWRMKNIALNLPWSERKSMRLLRKNEVVETL
jgi:hypothetical protein